IDQEYNVYVTSSLVHANTHPLAFWELEREHYPTIFRMAMDYLPIQPLSVPCERAFSSSSLTDTKQRNCINPILMEALQILKFSLKGERPNLKRWMTSQQEMLCDEDSSQILATVVSGHGNGIDEVLKAIEVEEGESLSNHVDIYWYRYHTDSSIVVIILKSRTLDFVWLICMALNLFLTALNIYV
ncbi:hypothetical protein PAXINDRAFT_70196, partial [Paxillus involutus ATCC 200175]